MAAATTVTIRAGRTGACLRLTAPLALAALALGGCATVSGSQSSSPAFAPSLPLVTYDAALEVYFALPDEASRKTYRDKMIARYIGDIDNRYERLKQQLRSTDRGSALFGDLVLLGLSGATALAGASAVDDLATVTAVATGARAAIDKRLFFDRTMTAVIAAMDARRTNLRADFESRRNQSDARYGLDRAIDDLRALSAAGNVHEAIEAISETALADQAAAQSRLDAIKEGCTDITRQSSTLNREFRELITQDPATLQANLEKAAKVVDLPSGTPLNVSSIMDAHETKFCSDARRRTAIDMLKEKIATN